MAKKSSVPAHIEEQYNKLVARHEDIERKGKANPFTSTNTYMHSFITKEFGLALRFPKTRQEELKEAGWLEVVEYNTLMKDFVQAPTEVFDNDELIDAFFRESFDYTNSLKPKKKKK